MTDLKLAWKLVNKIDDLRIAALLESLTSAIELGDVNLSKRYADDLQGRLASALHATAVIRGTLK